MALNSEPSSVFCRTRHEAPKTEHGHESRQDDPSEVTRHIVVTAACDLALQSGSSLTHLPCTPYKKWVQGWTHRLRSPQNLRAWPITRKKGSALQTLLVMANPRCEGERDTGCTGEDRGRVWRNGDMSRGLLGLANTSSNWKASEVSERRVTCTLGVNACVTPSGTLRYSDPKRQTLEIQCFPLLL